MAAKQINFLGGCTLSLAHGKFYQRPIYLGIQTAKETILGSQLLRILFFLGALGLASFAWRSAAKNNYLDGKPIFLGGFRPPRQFRILVVFIFKLLQLIF